MLKIIFTLCLVSLLITFLFGCSAQLLIVETGNTTVSDGVKDKVTIVITRDFGKELVLEQETMIEPDTTALETLQMVARVEMKYGGGFVSSINDIGSEYSGTNDKKKDWFFYINGVTSNVGAGDYILQAGDVEHWDFRDWSYQQFVPAIIGDYPQPFWSGYGDNTTPTVVVYEEAFAAEAESMVKKLKGAGVSQVSAIRDNRLSKEAKEQSNLIIIAGPDDELISELNKVHKKLGFYAYLESGNIIVLDAGGSASGEYGPGSGIIQATQNPWNPKGIGTGENVVWMVTGLDADGVRSAATVLTNNQDKLRYAFAAVVSEGRVVKLP